MAAIIGNRRQATRQLPRRELPRLVWKKSWNFGLMLLVLSAAVVYLSRSPQAFPVTQFEVSGDLQHQQRLPIENLLSGYHGEGFFSLPIHQLRYRLLQLPWVEQASVQRIWPQTVRVSITEKTPLARWDGEHLLSASGQVFPAEVEAFPELPLIYASSHSPEWAMQRFFELNAAFNSVNEQLVALRIDNRAAFDLQLQSGLTIKLGREQIDKRVGRLISIYEHEILPRRTLIEQLDLRYSNGFAVTWKPESGSQDNASIWSESNV